MDETGDVSTTFGDFRHVTEAGCSGRESPKIISAAASTQAWLGEVLLVRRLPGGILASGRDSCAVCRPEDVVQMGAPTSGGSMRHPGGDSGAHSQILGTTGDWRVCVEKSGKQW